MLELYTDEQLRKMTDEELRVVIDEAAHLQKVFKTSQLAKKVLINSLYGALGNQYFRFYSTINAAGVTMSGQLAIKWIERSVNELIDKLTGIEKDRVIAIDTDSIYVTLEDLIIQVASRKNKSPDEIDVTKWVDFLDKLGTNHVEPHIQKSYQELHEYMNSFEQRMFMDREAIADRGFWTGKKRYALNVWDNEGERKYDEHGNLISKLKIMGIETQRSSTPHSVQIALKESIRLILQEDEDALQTYVKKFKKEFDKIDYRELASVSSANNIEKYCDHNMYPVKGCPGHIKGVLAYNRIAQNHDTVDLIHSGDRVQIVELKQPNILHEETLAFPSGDKIPDEFGLDVNTFVNRHEMYNKHFISPLQTICEAIGWDYEQTASLDFLFGD